MSSTAFKPDLDLLFILDTTEDILPFLPSIKARCKEVCSALHFSTQIRQLHLGVLAFRDFRDAYVTKTSGGLTTNIDEVLNDLDALRAEGGGDCPEAVGTALDRALGMFGKSRKDAVKIAVLVTNAPPHGIGEDGDDYPNGEVGAEDPLEVARAMLKQGIILLVLACEPMLSNCFNYAHDFYQALAEITTGAMLPLPDGSLLAPLVIGFVLQELRRDILLKEMRSRVLVELKAGKTREEIHSRVVEELTLNNPERIITVTVPRTNVRYDEPESLRQTVGRWTSASTIGDVRQTGDPQMRFPAKDFLLPGGADIQPWPHDRKKITFMNNSPIPINFVYTGATEERTLEPGNSIERELRINEPYIFLIGMEERTIVVR